MRRFIYLSNMVLFFYFAFIVFLVPLLGAAQTVSINNDLGVGHHCVSRCLIYTLYVGDDIGDALKCGEPYDNDCYCATASASASVATSWLDKCAGSACAAGDLTRDLSTMQSIYASYCMNAGFTQPGATAWYDPSAAETTSSKTATAEPSRTATSGPPETTTQLTIVTQTTSGEGSGRSRGKSWSFWVRVTVPLLLVL